jgi:hypothetical protein
MTVPGGSESLANMLENALRALIRERTLEPAIAQVPFLEDQFTMLGSGFGQA